MSSWRPLGYGAAAILVAAAVGAELTSLDVVLPPVAVALAVIGAAALSVDYFGFSRRHQGWGGTIAPTAASRTAVAALERRFRREREAGALRTGATARTLLIALAEHAELRRAGDVVDFLATDAATRAHRDVVGDATRALALAELGRLDEAHVVDRALGDRAGATPIVALARGRIAELEGRAAVGLAAVDRGLRGDDRTGAARDLGLLRARLLARAGRLDDARAELALIAARGGRAAVEALLAPDRAEAAIAHAARQALGLGAVYR